MNNFRDSWNPNWNHKKYGTAFMPLVLLCTSLILNKPSTAECPSQGWPQGTETRATQCILTPIMTAAKMYSVFPMCQIPFSILYELFTLILQQSYQLYTIIIPP